MIFVTVGTTKFDALVRQVDSIAKKIKDEIIIQIGLGEYIPKNCKWFRFAPSLRNYEEEASMVISHEGAGTLIELAKLGKKVIALTNPYTVDNPDIIKKFSEENYLIWCKVPQDLEKALLMARKIKLRRYISPKCEIHKKILEKFA